MTFGDWLLIGGAAYLIHNGLMKEAADREKEAEEYAEYLEALKQDEELRNRRKAINEERTKTPCFFGDGLSAQIFEQYVYQSCGKIKRINSVSITGAKVRCNVVSQTGFTTWDFSLDFNDWGHITGTYWTQTNNDDSLVPHHLGQMVSEQIQAYYKRQGIVLRDLSEVIDQNYSLWTDYKLEYVVKSSFFANLFGHKKGILLTYCTEDFYGEHVFAVISMLKDLGFHSITTRSIKDVDKDALSYRYQVESVRIDGRCPFESGTYYYADAKIVITYHEKISIRMPYSTWDLKRKNRTDVKRLLYKEGYTNVAERRIEDLVTGWLIHPGSVEQVLIAGDEELPIEKNQAYDYDQNFVILYHAKK